MIKPSEPDTTLIKMPSLRAVRSFVAAAKYQSFTRAAEALCVTQAAISRQIRELEESLGTSLFVRTGRTVKLTADGSAFFDAAQLSFINISQAAQRIRTKDHAKHALTICCSPAFSSLWLQHRIHSFLEANADIEITQIAAQDFLAMESSVKPDIFITKMIRVREGYASQRLFHDVIYPVCSPKFLDEHPGIITLDDIRKAALLDLSPYGRSQLAEHIDWAVWLAFHGIRLEGRSQESAQIFKSNDYNALVQMAADGQGIALGWHHLVEHLISEGRLVRPVRHEIVHNERCHYLNIREEIIDSSAATRFREWILKEVDAMEHRWAGESG